MQRGFDDVSLDVPANAAESQQVHTADPHSELNRGRLLDAVDPHGTEIVSAWSLGGGLMGLGVALGFLGCGAALGRCWLEQQLRGGGRLMSMNLEVVYHQLFSLPLAAVSACALVAIMFWYPSLLVRFVVAILIMSPGTAAFFWAYHVRSGYALGDYFHGIPAMLFSFFIGSALVGMIAQMATRWELAHLQFGQRNRKVLDITRMLELTVVVALAYALFKSLDGGQISNQNAQFLTLGVLLSLPALCSCFLYLQRGKGPTHRLPWAIALVCCAWIGSFAFVAFQVAPSFGWTVIRYEYDRLASLALAGTAVVTVSASFSLLWLRFCGWSCQR